MTVLRNAPEGEWMYKYSFRDSSPVKRYVQVDPEHGYLLWGSSPTDDNKLSVNLKEAVGVIFGSQTTTFARLRGGPAAPPPYLCISILFVGRTLDLSTIEDTADRWFESIQLVISLNSETLIPRLHRRDVLFRKAWLKLAYEARERHVSVSQLFRDTIASIVSRRVRAPVGSALRQLNTLRESLEELRSTVRTVHKSTFHSFSDTLKDSLGRLIELKTASKQSETDTILLLEEELKACNAERVRLHNELIDLKGNVRVFVRVRPLLFGESDDLSLTDGRPSFVFIDEQPESLSVYIQRDVRRRTYTFDKVIRPSSDQVGLYAEIDPFVQSAIDGYNVCVFSYGVTNSGKTYSMGGTKDNPGINKLAVDKIFQSTKDAVVLVSVVQIYNETVTDLLNDGNVLDIRYIESSYCLPGMKEIEVKDPTSTERLIEGAVTLRATNSTRINQMSSRSHLIVTLKLSTGGRLHLIDLAGSENVNRSGATGGTLREAQNINKSLSALGDVVHALIESKQNASVHVPYRNSKLTMFLKDSLSGNSKTVMILQVSPAQNDINESLNSLSFGQRVRTVQVGKAIRSKHISPRE